MRCVSLVSTSWRCTATCSANIRASILPTSGAPARRRIWRVLFVRRSIRRRPSRSPEPSNTGAPMIGIPRRWTEAASAKSPDTPVSLAEATRVWAKIGWLSFGGPAGQIALMHRELVEQRRWISDARFLHALSYCMLLPGPEAQQLAIYIGWLMHRTARGVVAGTLFVLPGVIAIGVLGWLYVTHQQVPAVTAIFFGLKAAVLAGGVRAGPRRRGGGAEKNR